MPNPPLGSLVDSFTASTLNLGVWNGTTGGGLVTLAAPGRVAIQATAAFPTLSATGPYDATGQSLTARVTPALAGIGGQVVTTIMKIQKDSSNAASLTCTPGSTWQAAVTIAGVATTVNLPAFDPTAHAWWEITESSGTWLFSVSPDGTAWTQVASIAYSWAPTAVSVFFSAGSSTVSGEFAYIEHVNTALGSSSLMPSWPQIRFQVAFNQGASLSGQPAFVDLSSRLRGSWSAQLSGRQYELDQIQSGQLTASLWNLDGALDPLNTSSPYSPNVLPMKPCRMQAVWPPTRNLLPPGYANGTAAANQWHVYSGTETPATGLAPAPTGHTTAAAWQFPITASNANFYPFLTGPTAGSADATAFPVTAGLQYSLSMWLTRASSADPTININCTILWYRQDGSQISGSTGTATVPVTPTWVQLTATATAPAGAVSCRLDWTFATLTTTAVNTIYITAVQLEQAAAVTPWTSGGTVYPLWAGFIERWPQKWDRTGTYGTINITAVDALAALAQFTLNPSTVAQLLALGPTRMYPLDEPKGTVGFRDATGKHGFANIVNSPLGAGTLTAGSSITGTGFVGAPGPVVTLANPAPNVVAQAGTYINLGSPNGPPTSGGWTRLICFRTSTIPASGQAMALWLASGPTLSGASGGLYVDSFQQVQAYVQNTAGQTIQASVPTIAVCDGNWHMAAIILSADGKTLNVNVDGVGYVGTNTVDCHPTGIVDDTIGAYVTSRQNFYGWMFSGDLAYACEVPTNNVPSLSDIAAGFSTGWAGETSAARAQRILNLSGYGGALATMDATTAMGGANLAAQGVMTALQLVADTENGQVYADGANTVTLAGRLWRYYQNAPAVFIGEHQVSGEIPYLDDFLVEYDTTHIYNQVQVTNSGPPGSTQQPAALSSNAASSTAYAPRTLQRTINVQDVTVPQYAANYLSQQYSQPLARVAALTVDGSSNPALWSQVLPLGFGSRVQVSRRPPSGPGAAAITLQQFLEHLTWSGDDQGNLRASMQLSAAQPFLNWWIVASLHSTLQSTAASGQPVVTLGALTGSSLNPASAVLAAGTVLTVGYGAAGAENMTVLSVAATSPGYTSVAVTFTANLVNTHASGQTVCQPLPGGYTLPALPAAGFPASLDAGATLSATSPRVSY